MTRLLVLQLHSFLVFFLVVAGTNAKLLTQPSRGDVWLEDCRQRGFDPWYLACGTCELLRTPLAGHEDASVVIDVCLSCCQSYRDTQSLRQPYAAAVLVLPSSGGRGAAELESFLQEDWPELVQSRGKNRLWQMERPQESVADSATSQHALFSFLWGDRRPAEIHFLERPLPPSKTVTPDEISQRYAKESVELYGWKRDDIKDMIATLLPPQ